MTDETPDTPLRQSDERPLTQVESALKDHIQGLISISKGYNDKIKTAKTASKKVFYKKKLVKNNKEIVKYILAAERLRLQHSGKSYENAHHIEASAQDSSTTASGADQLRIETSLRD